MRFINLLVSAVVAFAVVPLEASAAPQDPAIRAPFIVEQTYWIRPGKEPQFIALFEKNRVPLLRAKIKQGELVWVRFTKPQFNATNDQWDLRVTLAWRDADSAIERVSSANAQQAQRLALEQQIIEELIVERTEVPVQEWNVKDGGS